MRFQVLAVLALGMLIGIDKALAEDVKKDLEKRHGDGDLVSAEMKGKDVTRLGKQAFRMTIKDKKFVLQFGGNRLEFTFRINSAKSPKEIDFDPDEVKPALGIFAFEGDKLKLSWLPREDTGGGQA